MTGTGNGTLNWTGTSAGTVSGALPLTINSISAGSYSISFQSSAGCSSNTLLQNLNDPTPPTTPTITASGPLEICEGETVTLTSSSTTGNTWSTGETTASIAISLPGSYSVTYTNPSGCSATSTSVAVVTNPLPVVTFGSLENICINDPILTLTQGSPAGGVYSGNGIIGNQFDPNVAGLGSSLLTYEYTDGNGCSNSALSFIWVDGCLGISEQSTSKLTIFPNPSSGWVMLESTNGIILTLIVYDEAGRKVAEHKDVNSSSSSVDLSKMANGMYTFEIVTDADIRRVPIVIQH